jgi:hypothetical protein
VLSGGSGQCGIDANLYDANPGEEKGFALIADIGGPAEFVTEMRRFKARTGLGYKQLEARARRLGLPLPHSTLAATLSRDALPRSDLLEAFLRAGGAGEDEVTEWLSTLTRLESEALEREIPLPATEPGGLGSAELTLPEPAAESTLTAEDFEPETAVLPTGDRTPAVRVARAAARTGATGLPRLALLPHTGGHAIALVLRPPRQWWVRVAWAVTGVLIAGSAVAGVALLAGATGLARLDRAGAQALISEHSNGSPSPGRSPSPSAKPSPVPFAGWYRLRPVLTYNQHFCVSLRQDVDKLTLVQEACSTSYERHFRFELVGRSDSTVRIRPRSNRMGANSCASVNDVGSFTTLYLLDCGDPYAVQSFYIERTRQLSTLGALYRFRPTAHPARCLGVAGRSTRSEAAITEQPCNGTDSQEFVLERP